MVRLVDDAKAQGDTLGGAVTIIAHGVPVGLGSHVAWNEKLDGRIAQAMMSVPAVKAVEIGAASPGRAASAAPRTTPSAAMQKAAGSAPTNRAGGLEGGITNGEDVVVTLYKKPIATLRDGLPSVDLDPLRAARLAVRAQRRHRPARRRRHRRVDARPGARRRLLEKFGGDSMAELLAHFEGDVGAAASLAGKGQTAPISPRDADRPGNAGKSLLIHGRTEHGPAPWRRSGERACTDYGVLILLGRT